MTLIAIRILLRHSWSLGVACYEFAVQMSRRCIAFCVISFLTLRAANNASAMTTSRTHRYSKRDRKMNGPLVNAHRIIKRRSHASLSSPCSIRLYHIYFPVHTHICDGYVPSIQGQDTSKTPIEQTYFRFAVISSLVFMQNMNRMNEK